jgi:heme exporter protein CcmD
VFDFPYAAYIVPAFTVTVLVFAGMIGVTLAKARRWRKRFEERAGK